MHPGLLTASPLTTGHVVLLLVAGVAAGIVNGIAGGGTVITFPTLLAVGYPAITANVTSTVGVMPGYVGGVTGFRREIHERRHLLARLVPVALLGAIGGSVLLLNTPASAFDRLAPYLILLAAILFAVQPLLSRWLRSERSEHSGGNRPKTLLVGVFVTSIYGGYFGAGLGVMLLALLGLTLPDDLASMTGLRSVLSIVANGTAAVVFILRAHVVWDAAGLIAIGCLAGGFAGAHLVRTLPAPVIRAIVVAIGLGTAVKLFIG
jgi:uncharacterized membrane protein YfcA